jgi:Phycobilisome protein
MLQVRFNLIEIHLKILHAAEWILGENNDGSRWNCLMTQLSEKVQVLIQKARIVSFQTWTDIYPGEVLDRFQAAEDQSRYLTDEDLALIRSPDEAAIKLLRDRAPEIVDQAREQVLNTFPNITQPGGGLYPAMRADACWRDFWQFLRCITYGIAGNRTDYTSADGLHHMNLLYQELQVPLDAMVVGLEGIKQASLSRVDADLAPFFDRLIDQLRQFH